MQAIAYRVRERCVEHIMSAKLHAALEFAVKAHAGQDRDGKMPPPYACHPVEVMMNLRYTGKVEDEDLLAAALLHDTVEESGVEFTDILDGFGNRVESLVRELTRYEPTASETAGMTGEEIWELRSGLLLKEISEMTSNAQQIKLADRLSNLREARLTKPPKKLKRYEDQTKRILEIIPRGVNPGLWTELRSEVATSR